MDVSSPLLWAVWALFGTLVIVVAGKMLHAAVTTPGPERVEAVDPGQPWLYCEEGAPLDLEARWFRVRPGEKTVLGGRPRSATADTSYVYLAAHDVAEDHALIRFDPEQGRYRMGAPTGASIQHNNEPVTDGEEVSLTDGDVLQLGAQSRFRFTLTGPPGGTL